MSHVFHRTHQKHLPIYSGFRGSMALAALHVFDRLGVHISHQIWGYSLI